MRRMPISVMLVCLFLLLVTAGCAAEDQAPGYVETHSMTGLDGGLDSPYGPISPVMQDVYDRSIPAEVYSGK